MTTSRPSSPSRGGLVVALLAVAALAVGACVPTQGEASPTPTLAPTTAPSPNPYDGVSEGAGAGMKLGYVSFGENVPFVFDVSEGIRAQVAVAGAELVECDAQLNGNRVADCMKQLSDAGVKGIIQFQGELSDPAVACGAVPSGVPVVAVEWPQPPCSATVVGADDLRAGQIAGRAVGEWVKERWSCTYDAYVSFESQGSAPDRSQRRIEGYRQGFSAVCPVTNEQIGRAIDTRAAAETAMGDVLKALPDKGRIVVVAVNDDAAAGALDGAAAAGRSGDVWVSGQGAEARFRDLIRTNPQWIGDAAYFPEKYGATIVPALLDLIAGKAVPAQLLIEPAWVDASNIGQIYPQ